MFGAAFLFQKIPSVQTVLPSVCPMCCDIWTVKSRMTSTLWSSALGQEPQEVGQTLGFLTELAHCRGSDARGRGPKWGAEGRQS